MLLSVIVPAYNVERWIDACLDSVFALPLSDDEMEVIVVDDGSTDSTPQRLAHAAEGHPNLRVLHQANQGQSVARNLAIEAARGQYLYMVDADDALPVPCPLPLDDIRSGRFDMVGVETLFEDAQGHRRRYCHQTFPYDREYAAGREYLACHNVLGIVYGYVFRTSFVQQHAALRFTPGIYHQDEEFIVKAFCLAGRFVFRRGYTYIYYQHAGSSIHTFTRQRRERLMNDTMTVVRNLLAFAPDGTTPRHWQPWLHFKMGYMAMDILRLLIRQRHDEAYAMDVLRQITDLGLYPLPWLKDVKFLGFKLLTATPWLFRFWLRHPQLLPLA